MAKRKKAVKKTAKKKAKKVTFPPGKTLKAIVEPVLKKGSGEDVLSIDDMLRVAKLGVKSRAGLTSAFDNALRDYAVATIVKAGEASRLSPRLRSLHDKLRKAEGKKPIL